MKRSAVLSRILMALIGLGLPFCGAHANTEIIEEVVVTAELRSVPVNDVAASVSLLIPDDNADVVNHLEEMLGRAVNVNIASGASRARVCRTTSAPRSAKRRGATPPSGRRTSCTCSYLCGEY